MQIAKNGDRLVIKGGIHEASEIVINKAVEIVGEPDAVLDGQGKTILYINHDSVTVRDIELRNVETNYVEDRAALKANTSNYLIVQNVKVRQSFFGILIENSKHGLVVNCDIQGEADAGNYLESSNGNAIHLWYCAHMQILNNVVKKHRDGIYFEFVKNSTISGNLSQANMRYGLHFMFSSHNVYADNVFTENGAGVAVMYSDHVTMTRNKFIKNWGESAYGLLMKDIKDSKLEYNIFSGNTIAISSDNSIRVVIRNNRFSKNGYALRIMGNSTDNLIHDNDFIENTFDVITNSKSSFNDFNGNYWEEYTGYDLNKDGIGDVPHRPIKLFTYIVAQSPASVILLRSTFIDLLNLAEKVAPVITPESLVDNHPKMKPINDHLDLRI
ncbi:MAG: right-handed parallel beta-helix repeat-containing protein [Salibacteraceae bacterium]